MSTPSRKRYEFKDRIKKMGYAINKAEHLDAVKSIINKPCIDISYEVEHLQVTPNTSRIWQEQMISDLNDSTNLKNETI